LKPHEQAKAWRLKVGLTVPQLAELSGFAENTIWLFERGVRENRVKISEWSWQRYQMACAGVEAQIRSGRKFEW
jgi:hypothetical protein